MADFPADLVSKSRSQIESEYLRDFSVRMTQLGITIDTSPGSQPWVYAKTLANQLNTLQNNQILIARRTLINQLTGAKLDEYGVSRGLPRSTGGKSFGAVRITTSTGGTTIGAGNVSVTNPSNSVSYVVTVPGTYTDQSLVTIQSVNLGNDTNLFPGTKLRFASPSAGLAPDCVVVADANGQGLTGGADIETDEHYQQRLIDDFRNPQGNGNRSEVRALIQETSPNLEANRPGHGVPVECGFVYPCSLGPGSFSFTFTVPGKGNARRPSAPQIAAVEAYVKAYIGEDMSIISMPISVDVLSGAAGPSVFLRFAPNVTGWLDLDQFPRYFTSTQGFPRIGTVTSATEFQVIYTVYTGVAQPRVGQTICVFDSVTRTYIPKRILSFTGTGPWTITVDPSNSASNTSYVPTTSQHVMPYSVKLDALGALILASYDGMGPGECVSSIVARDPELRGHRFPSSNEAFPYIIGTDFYTELLARDDVDSILPISPTNGTFTTTATSGGVSVNMVIPTNVDFYPA